MANQKIAVIDDYQNIALECADWSPVRALADVTLFNQAWTSEDDLVDKLSAFDIIMLLRERTAFPARVLERLPNLKFIAMTGARTSSLDLQACAKHNILVSYTSSHPSTATAELTIALMLSCARSMDQAIQNIKNGRWQEELALGSTLEGKCLGIVGLGKLGSRVAHIAKAFGMEVVAWSQNLTEQKAAEQGVRRVEKSELFRFADVVSIHLTLSDRTRGIIGREELLQMKQGAILVNTSRGPLIDENSLIDVLQSKQIVAGLDVYDVEPLRADHPFRSLSNVVATPHIGYAVDVALQHFFQQSVENVLAYLRGTPQRIKTAANP